MNKCVALILAALSLCASALAQTPAFPVKTIRLVVAESLADGYTLLMTAPGPLAVNANLYATLPFDPATAFAPVSLAGVAPLLLVVPASLSVRNLKELLDYATANPSKATCASQGKVSSGHLTMELLKVRTGMQATHVRGGALRAIAVAEEKRLVASPDIPTVAEQGLPGFFSTRWFGIVTTAGTPSAVVEKLSAAINETLRTPAVQVWFLEMGVELRPNSPQAFESYISAETMKWNEVVRVSGAKLD
jgi:tripartite-type tricarboxylate transporter receptor subunit TctC